jgi:hypothetical protein
VVLTHEIRIFQHRGCYISRPQIRSRPCRPEQLAAAVEGYSGAARLPRRSAAHPSCRWPALPPRSSLILPTPLAPLPCAPRSTGRHLRWSLLSGLELPAGGTVGVPAAATARQQDLPGERRRRGREMREGERDRDSQRIRLAKHTELGGIFTELDTECRI